jgi:hypothetical protein
MRILDHEEANIYLNAVGMKIGGWNEICDASDREYDHSQSTKYQAPKGSRELHNFAQHVASWLPNGTWKLFQIDNSTSPLEHETFLIRRLLFCSAEQAPLPFTLLFEIESGGLNEELLLSNLIFLFLLFELHGEIVSSNSRNGKYLSIQDGFVYFMSRDDRDIVEAKALLNRFDEQPLRMVGFSDES